MVTTPVRKPLAEVSPARVANSGNCSPRSRYGSEPIASKLQALGTKGSLLNPRVKLLRGDADVMPFQSSQPQVEQQRIILARSPMQGSTPGEMRRMNKKAFIADAPKAPQFSAVSNSPGAPSQVAPTAPKLVPTMTGPVVPPFCDESTGSVKNQTISGENKDLNKFSVLFEGPSVETIPDSKLSQEQLEKERKKAEAKAKREAAKAKREATAAFKAAEAARMAEEARLKAEAEAKALEQQNQRVEDLISVLPVSEPCTMIHSIQELRWELVSICQCLNVLQQELALGTITATQLECAFQCEPDHSDCNLLQDLHCRLLEIVRSGHQKKNKVRFSRSSAAWKLMLAEWADEELGDRSPLNPCDGEDSDCEEMDYDDLDTSQKIDLLHELCGHALSSQKFDADVLRWQKIGADSEQRAYWHFPSTSGKPNLFIMRDNFNTHKTSRDSLLSNEGTPKRVNLEENKKIDIESSKDAPERGESGENYYWHKHWTAVMSRSSRPDPAPALELVANDMSSILKTVKCLWTSESEQNLQLARHLVDAIIIPAKNLDDCISRKTSVRTRMAQY